MKNKIITISREFGSGGRTIGKKWQKNWALLVTTGNCSRKLRRRADSVKSMFRMQGNTHLVDFWHLHSLIGIPDPIMQIISGKSSIGQLWSWRKKDLVSLWAGVQIIFCGTKQIAFGCLSMQAWIFGQSVLSKNMENVRYLPNSVYETKIDGGRPIIDFIPI